MTVPYRDVYNDKRKAWERETKKPNRSDKSDLSGLFK